MSSATAHGTFGSATLRSSNSLRITLSQRILAVLREKRRVRSAAVSIRKYRGHSDWKRGPVFSAERLAVQSKWNSGEVGRGVPILLTSTKNRGSGRKSY